MDIYRFINSRDIREHLKNINYCFSSIESSWIIWKSKYATLNEKHRAWREIIETMPDCEIEKRPNTIYCPSLHRFLEKLMKIDNRCIEAMKESESCAFFSCRYLLSHENSQSDRIAYRPEMFSDFSTCLHFAIDECKHSWVDDDIVDCRFCIRKSWVDERKNCIIVETNHNGEIVKIRDYGEMTDEEYDLVERSFDGMWFDFPNPFKRGDIIYNPGRFDSADFECDYGLCVLEEEIPLRRCIESWKISGDSSDMTVHGLFQNTEGMVFSECTANYMNFEQYHGELNGKNRILMAISNYLKGNISLDLLLNAYHIIITEEHIKDFQPYNIIKEGLEFAGILKGKLNE